MRHVLVEHYDEEKGYIKDERLQVIEVGRGIYLADEIDMLANVIGIEEGEDIQKFKAYRVIKKTQKDDRCKAVRVKSLRTLERIVREFKINFC